MTTTSEAPKERAASDASAPIGPAPVTSTRAPGPMSALAHAHRPTEKGSSSAAAWSERSSGTANAKSAGATT